MRLLEFRAENFKKLRVVEITPKKRLVQITGRNGQGKTSTLDALWALFAGKRAIPERPVRKGADKAKLSATVSDDNGKPLLIAKRTIRHDRTTELTIEAAPGAERPAGTPQAVLDELVGAMTLDPVSFITMDPKEQVEALREIIAVDVDFEALAEANKKDYDERRILGRDYDRLRAEASAIPAQEVPAAAIDVETITRQLADAGEKNKDARRIDDERARAERDAAQAWSGVEQVKNTRDGIESRIRMLKRELDQQEKLLKAADSSIAAAEKAAKKMSDDAQTAPKGDYVDVTELTRELTAANETNRQIERQLQRTRLLEDAAAKDKEITRLTRAMEQREERKRDAFTNAKLPVPGLTFDENGVLLHGLPLASAGEAEQIRVSVALAMASKPKLRMIPIRHGESLDDRSLALIEQLAEENDFYVFMARVETSGKVGVYIVDGEVEADNQ
jgi:DNA repair exonuclease SbcCD ATPase subunit